MSKILITLFLLLLSANQKKDLEPTYYLIQVIRETDTEHESWARVVMAKDSLAAKKYMIQFLEHVYPAEKGVLGGFLIRKLNFKILQYNVVKVKPNP